MTKRINKQFILMLFDLVSIAIAYQLAGFIRFRWILGFNQYTEYRNLFFVFLLLYIIIYGCLNRDEGFLKRGYLDELIHVFRLNVCLMAVLLSLLFLLKIGVQLSRGFYLCFFSLSIIISLCLRIYYKVWLQACYRKSESSEKVLIVTSKEWAERVVKQFREECVGSSYITGVAIIDEDCVGSMIRMIPVIANKDNILDVAAKEVVDTVLINIPNDNSIDLNEMILQFQNMGTTIELCIQTLPIKLEEKMVKSYQGFHVLTYSTRIFNSTSLALKRLIDIIGALVGLSITLLVSIFIVPAIFIESPGPVIFKQTRIGKNGRRFKIYKFRSMYMDAEKRKKELMEKNQMSGLMFKMDDDPRITKVGKFIRKTSIDELPQFFNVLVGNMSLVGTRPPTEEEFLQYEVRHKRRLALKPGITGLWQVSGRSDITDFEEVVRLDTKYIDEWSMMGDLKILCRTVWIVVFGVGAK